MRSATKPPPTVTGTELAIPMTNRAMINMGILILAAQTIAAIIKRMFAACVGSNLPHTSERGVKKIGPNADPIT